ncbi:hypothetical protein [Paenibacillus crassostreae]|uniref:Uncharacterized protein n=1 Tax=Paenibacillus crassostreae TaxID=1763538 RepID=A0A167ADN5_9BACL|nr:hypothetical protein [Paenibacillus crassostreae]AOZ92426.1 hypothetical protein LPB68_09395 [Paenibacillus crassostreae]OAB70888.1 hypothetical protein PNBC_21545 [Paenibacillus crassostreae]
MTITYKFIEDCFQSIENEEIPQFDLCKNDSATFTVLKLQCKGNIIASPEEGPRFENSDYTINLFPDALRLAKTKNVDLFLTPEYSIPLNIIEQIISTESMHPPLGKLWCICTQGIEVDVFDQFIKDLKGNAKLVVITDAAENYSKRFFVNSLFYIFKLTSGKLCITPQLKTKSMADRSLECEEVGLSLGSIIYRFGRNQPNQLISLICADSLNQRDVSISKLFECGNESIVLLHPQLNTKPRQDDFSSLRKELFRSNEGSKLVYISQNWAEDSSIAIKDSGDSELIDSPWSSIYVKNNNKNWNNDTRSHRKNNHLKGLGFAYWLDKKVNIWFSSKRENMQFLHVRKPCQLGPMVTTPTIDVKCYESFYPDESRSRWVDAQKLFDEDLNDIESLLTDEYKFPLTAQLEDRDYFFGVSLGKNEESQLIANKDEYCNRLGISIDLYSEKTRVDGIDQFINLANCLREKRLPSHIKGLRENHRFGLNKLNNHNLFSVDSEDVSALVCFVSSEELANKTADILIKNMDPQNKEKICVFSSKKGNVTEIVTFPQYDTSIDASVRVKPRTNISEG